MIFLSFKKPSYIFTTHLCATGAWAERIISSGFLASDFCLNEVNERHQQETGEWRKRARGVCPQVSCLWSPWVGKVLELAKSLFRKTQILAVTSVHTLTFSETKWVLLSSVLCCFRQHPMVYCMQAHDVSLHPSHTVEIIRLLSSLQIIYFQWWIFPAEEFTGSKWYNKLNFCS